MYEFAMGIVSIGILVLFLVFAWFIFQIGRNAKAVADKDERYQYLEIGFIDRIAEKYKINIDKIKLKYDFIFNRGSNNKHIKSIRTMIQDSIRKEMNDMTKLEDEIDKEIKDEKKK